MFCEGEMKNTCAAISSGGKQMRQGRSPTGQPDLSALSRRGFEIAARRAVAFRSVTARLREPRDRPDRAIEASE